MNKGNPELQRAMLKKRCKYDFETFCMFFYQKTCAFPFGSFHREYFKFHEIQTRNKQGLFLWPRGHSKSTTITRAATVHDICYKRELYTVLFSDTATQSRKKSRAIRNDLKNNARLKWVFGDSISPSDLWREDLFKTKNGCVFQAASARTEARGFIEDDNRPTSLKIDDVENSEEVLSPLNREKRKDWFNEVIEFIGAPGLNIEVVGTMLHDDSLLAYLVSRSDYKIFRHRGLVSFPENTELWNQWREIYINLDDENREENAEKFYQSHRNDMDKGAKALWEDNKKPKYPTKVYELMATRINVGEGAFNKEIQNDPHDQENQIFDLDNADYFILEEFPDDGLCIVRGAGIKVPVKSLTIIGVHDPSDAKAKTKTKAKTGRSDFGCISFVGVEPHKKDEIQRMYILDVWLKRCPVSQQITKVFELCSRWKPVYFYVKDTGAIGLYEAFNRVKEQRKKDELFYDIALIFVNETENKIERIAHMEPYVSNKWLSFNKGLPFEFFDQMKQFPTHVHDDGPDSVHHAWHILKHTGAISTGMRRL